MKESEYGLTTKIARPKFAKRKQRSKWKIPPHTGFGGNSAMPERIQKEAAPAACSVRSRSQPKSFLFLLEEKNWRAQIKKCEENFFAGWRALASGGGLASLVGVLLKESSREVYNYSPKTELNGFFKARRSDAIEKTPTHRAHAASNFLFDRLPIFNLMKTTHHFAIANLNPCRRKHRFDY